MSHSFIDDRISTGKSPHGYHPFECERFDLPISIWFCGATRPPIGVDGVSLSSIANSLISRVWALWSSQYP